VAIFVALIPHLTWPEMAVRNSVRGVSLVTRLGKSLHNRTHLLAMLARGAATRALRPGVLQGGRGLSVGRNVDLNIYGDLEVGEDVILSDGCSLQVGPGARLVLGDHVFVGRHAVLVAADLIEVGSDTLIAEHCTIRDQNHHVQPEARLRETSAVTAPVRIAPKVWIGAGARILKGTTIGEGAIVGANAVVTGEIPARVIAGGIPARVLRSVSEPK
jgi:acetyltransferase-like isoleucine patch superfamily enzyme